MPSSRGPGRLFPRAGARSCPARGGTRESVLRTCAGFRCGSGPCGPGLREAKEGEERGRGEPFWWIGGPHSTGKRGPSRRCRADVGRRVVGRRIRRR